jgi:hypothetical protein
MARSARSGVAGLLLLSCAPPLPARLPWPRSGPCAALDCRPPPPPGPARHSLPPAFFSRLTYTPFSRLISLSLLASSLRQSWGGLFCRPARRVMEDPNAPLLPIAQNQRVHAGRCAAPEQPCVWVLWHAARRRCVLAMAFMGAALASASAHGAHLHPAKTFCVRKLIRKGGCVHQQLLGHAATDHAGAAGACEVAAPSLLGAVAGGGAGCCISAAHMRSCMWPRRVPGMMRPCPPAACLQPPTAHGL